MAKNKKRQKKKAPSGQTQQAKPHHQDREDREEPSRKFDWLPLWGWALVFLIPLVVSEFMFYVAGREISMILFPIAWFGFWIALMQRSGWPILKREKDR